MFCFSSTSGQSFQIHATSEGDASKQLLKQLGIRMMGVMECKVVDTVRVPLTQHHIPSRSLMGRVVRLGFGNF